MLPGTASVASTAAPLDLPRLVMRRARLVAIAFLVLAAALGMLATRHDTRDEIDGALALARLGQRIGDLPADDARALASLQGAGRLRHVRLRITDGNGRALLDTASAPPPAALRWLMSATLHGETVDQAPSVSWPVARANGQAWTVAVTPDPESEQREALTNLLGLFGLLVACCLLMLAVMTWNVRRAFHPLQTLLAAIAGIERQDLSGVDALPTMPIRELEATSQALKQLAGSLRRAEDSRRALARKVLTLQEDERQRLARDLHDEFGQRLTAMRVDAAWLGKRLAQDSAAAQVLAAMGEQIAFIQTNVREMLARLQPLSANGNRPDGAESVASLAQLLDTLAATWLRSDRAGLRCEARVRLRGADARSTDEPAPLDLALPGPIVLTLYRISQEAFTNIARHAGATRARVEVEVACAEDGGVALTWSASDDGCGLARPESALQRGNGLAGMQERIWAHGGEFEWAPSGAAPMRGLELRARLACRSVETAS
jgi:two-component system sensor histidine kinase UhpB